MVDPTSRHLWIARRPDPSFFGSSEFPTPGSAPNRRSGSPAARRPLATPCALPQPAADRPPTSASGQGPPGRPAAPGAHPLRDEGDGTLSQGSGRAAPARRIARPWRGVPHHPRNPPAPRLRGERPSRRIARGHGGGSVVRWGWLQGFRRKELQRRLQAVVGDAAGGGPGSSRFALVGGRRPQFPHLSTVGFVAGLQFDRERVRAGVGGTIVENLGPQRATPRMLGPASARATVRPWISAGTRCSGTARQGHAIDAAGR